MVEKNRKILANLGDFENRITFNRKTLEVPGHANWTDFGSRNQWIITWSSKRVQKLGLFPSWTLNYTPIRCGRSTNLHQKNWDSAMKGTFTSSSRFMNFGVQQQKNQVTRTNCVSSSFFGGHFCHVKRPTCFNMERFKVSARHPDISQTFGPLRKLTLALNHPGCGRHRGRKNFAPPGFVPHGKNTIGKTKVWKRGESGDFNQLTFCHWWEGFRPISQTNIMIISDVSQVLQKLCNLQEGARDPSYKGSEITPFQTLLKNPWLFSWVFH